MPKMKPITAQDEEEGGDLATRLFLIIRERPFPVVYVALGQAVSLAFASGGVDRKTFLGWAATANEHRQQLADRAAADAGWARHLAASGDWSERPSEDPEDDVAMGVALADELSPKLDGLPSLAVSVALGRLAASLFVQNHADGESVLAWAKQVNAQREGLAELVAGREAEGTRH